MRLVRPDGPMKWLVVEDVLADEWSWGIGACLGLLIRGLEKLGGGLEQEVWQAVMPNRVQTCAESRLWQEIVS